MAIFCCDFTFQPEQYSTCLHKAPISYVGYSFVPEQRASQILGPVKNIMDQRGNLGENCRYLFSRNHIKAFATLTKQKQFPNSTFRRMLVSNNKHCCYIDCYILNLILLLFFISFLCLYGLNSLAGFCVKIGNESKFSCELMENIKLFFHSSRSKRS